MAKKNPLVTLEQILTECDHIIAWVNEIDRETFLSDLKQQRIFERELEIIGEAVKRLPESLLLQYPEVDWRKVEGVRNRIVHGYDMVDLYTVWEIITGEVPQLRIDIQRIKHDLEFKS